MTISTGNPTADGRYVVFTRCQAATAREYCEPIIVTWAGGKWHFGRRVYGWIGPLPICRALDLVEPREYDL